MEFNFDELLEEKPKASKKKKGEILEDSLPTENTSPEVKEDSVIFDTDIQDISFEENSLSAEQNIDESSEVSSDKEEDSVEDFLNDLDVEESISKNKEVKDDDLDSFLEKQIEKEEDKNLSDYDFEEVLKETTEPMEDKEQDSIEDFLKEESNNEDISSVKENIKIWEDMDSLLEELVVPAIQKKDDDIDSFLEDIDLGEDSKTNKENDFKKEISLESTKEDIDDYSFLSDMDEELPLKKEKENGKEDVLNVNKKEVKEDEYGEEDFLKEIWDFKNERIPDSKFIDDSFNDLDLKDEVLSLENKIEDKEEILPTDTTKNSLINKKEPLKTDFSALEISENQTSWKDSSSEEKLKDFMNWLNQKIKGKLYGIVVWCIIWGIVIWFWIGEFKNSSSQSVPIEPKTIEKIVEKKVETVKIKETNKYYVTFSSASSIKMEVNWTVRDIPYDSVRNENRVSDETKFKVISFKLDSNWRDIEYNKEISLKELKAGTFLYKTEEKESQPTSPVSNSTFSWTNVNPSVNSWGTISNSATWTSNIKETMVNSWNTANVNSTGSWNTGFPLENLIK